MSGRPVDVAQVSAQDIDHTFIMFFPPSLSQSLSFSFLLLSHTLFSPTEMVFVYVPETGWSY